MASSAITQAEAQQQKYDSHLKYAALLQQETVLLKQLAIDSGNPTFISKLAADSVQARLALAQLPPIVLQIKGVFEGAFTGLFENIMSGTKKAKTIFLDFFNSIAKGIDQIVAKILADKVANALFGGAGAGITGGSGLDFGSILGKFGSAIQHSAWARVPKNQLTSSVKSCNVLMARAANFRPVTVCAMATDVSVTVVAATMKHVRNTFSMKSHTA